MCLKKLDLACSPGNEYINWCAANPQTCEYTTSYTLQNRRYSHLIERWYRVETRPTNTTTSRHPELDQKSRFFTLISPSAAPVTKNSSCGSNAKHRIGESCNCDRYISLRCLRSNIKAYPFFPADISNWCCGAYSILEAPWSWHWKPSHSKEHFTCVHCHLSSTKFVLMYLQVTRAFFCGSNESHNATFLLSDECPAVATKLHEPKNTKSLVTLLWHWYVWNWNEESYNNEKKS